jgi:hypothetical protein
MLFMLLLLLLLLEAPICSALLPADDGRDEDERGSLVTGCAADKRVVVTLGMGLPDAVSPDILSLSGAAVRRTGAEVLGGGTDEMGELLLRLLLPLLLLSLLLLVWLLLLLLFKLLMLLLSLLRVAPLPADVSPALSVLTLDTGTGCLRGFCKWKFLATVLLSVAVICFMFDSGRH